MTRPVDIPIISKEPVASVLRILALEEIGEDLFRAHSLPQVRRVYGGQVIAQALIAAAATMDKPRLPHSFHTYFARGGTPSLPFELRVERLRDGRSFSLRRIVCLQEGKEILALQASYQGPEDGLVFTSEAPEATPPEELPSAFEIFRAIDHPVGRFLGKTTAFDVRHVQQSLYTKADENPSNRQQLWMRPRAAIPQGADQHVHRALLAYVIDQVMLEPAMRVLGLSWMTCPQLLSTMQCGSIAMSISMSGSSSTANARMSTMVGLWSRPACSLAMASSSLRPPSRECCESRVTGERGLAVGVLGSIRRRAPHS